MFKVLIVDDDPSISMFISKLLTKKFSCKVVTADNGLEGLNKVKSENPEVIFLDVTMPVMSGMEMLDALRQNNDYKNIPIIMLTAINDKNIVSEAMSKGVISYLLKPLMFEETYQKIKELLYQIKRQKDFSEKMKEFQKEQSQPEKLVDSFLIVSSEESVRVRLREQMQANFDVIEAENGVDGLELFLKEKPKIVCLGENLPMLNEVLFASKIRSIITEGKTLIFLLSDTKVLSEEEKKYFDLVIPRKSDMNNFFPGI